jgi:hypothetical protein
MMRRIVLMAGVALATILPGNLGMAQNCHPAVPCTIWGTCVPVPTSLPPVNTGALNPDGYTTAGGNCGIKRTYIIIPIPCGPPLGSSACIDV